MGQDSIPRRSFLATGSSLMGAAMLTHPLRGWFPLITARQSTGQGSRAPISQTDTRGMIVHSEEYVTREMPVSFLDGWITPADRFFVRNNLLMPSFNIADWRLVVTGEVVHRLELGYEEFTKLEPRQVTNTLECAGNGRAFFRPRIGGVPWGRGGVGNAVFSGPPLRALLRRAGLKATARHVAFRGLDVPPIGTESFIRSVPIEKAMDPDTLLALEMNGAPLSPEHGYPVRALVPGWIGSASIKWLTEVRVLEQEFQGYFMKTAYRVPELPVTAGKLISDAETMVITSLAVKSIIVQPADGSDVPLNGSAPVRIAGAAWAGETVIVSVEISTDGGRLWHDANLAPEQARYAWRLWSFDWTPMAPGSYLLMSRAKDSQGRSQALQTPWNPQGYSWNAIDRIRVDVRAKGAQRH